MKKFLFSSSKIFYRKKIFKRENLKVLLDQWNECDLSIVKKDKSKLIITKTMRDTFEKIKSKMDTPSTFENIFYIVGEPGVGKTSVLKLYEELGKTLGWKKETASWVKKSTEEASEHLLNLLKPFLTENNLSSIKLTEMKSLKFGDTIEDLLNQGIEKKITQKKAVALIFEELSKSDEKFLFIFDDYDPLLYDKNAIDDRRLFCLYPYSESIGNTQFKNAAYIIGLQTYSKGQFLLPSKSENINYIGNITKEDLKYLLGAFPPNNRKELATIGSSFLMDYILMNHMLQAGVEDAKERYIAHKIKLYGLRMNALFETTKKVEVYNLFSEFADFLFGFKKTKGAKLSNFLQCGLGFKNQKNEIVFRDRYAYSAFMSEFKKRIGEMKTVEYSYRHSDLESIMIGSEKSNRFLLREIGSSLLESKTSQFDIDVLALDGVTADTISISIVVNKVSKNLKDINRDEFLVMAEDSLVVPEKKIIFKVVPLKTLGAQFEDEMIQKFMKENPDFTLIYLSFKKSKDLLLNEITKIKEMLPECTDRVFLSFQDDYIQGYPLLVKHFEELEQRRKEENEVKVEDDWTDPNFVTELASEMTGKKSFRGMVDLENLVSSQKNK